VPSGQCRAIAPSASAYNHSRRWARVWEWTEDRKDGRRCGGRSMVIAPGRRAARFCDPAPGKGCFAAEGLGGRYPTQPVPPAVVARAAPCPRTLAISAGSAPTRRACTPG
jgi:hypothetical protein